MLVLQALRVVQERRPLVYEAIVVHLYLAIYLTVGCAFYMEVEGWTLIDSLYFSMVTMSTVGYGDLSPTMAGSRVFTIIYIVVGIVSVFVRLSGLVGRVGFAVEHWLVENVRKLFSSTKDHGPSMTGSGVFARSTSKSAMVDISGDGNADYIMPMKAWEYWVQGYTFNVVVFAALQLLSAFVFSELLPIDYGVAFYHTLITATTVGYGDVSISTPEARLFAFFHILLSVSWLGASISQFGELKTVRQAQLTEFEMLQKQLDAKLIQSLDKDGLGVERVEFVVGMLSNLGATYAGAPLTMEACKPFFAQFDAMDVDKSGRLDQKDLQTMADKVQKKREEAEKKGHRHTFSGQKAGVKASPRAQGYSIRIAPSTEP